MASAASPRTASPISDSASTPDKYRDNPILARLGSKKAINTAEREAAYRKARQDIRERGYEPLPMPLSPPEPRSQRQGFSKLFSSKQKTSKTSAPAIPPKSPRRASTASSPTAESPTMQASLFPTPSPQSPTIYSVQRPSAHDNAKINIRRPPQGVKNWFDALDDESDDDFPEVVEMQCESHVHPALRQSPSSVRSSGISRSSCNSSDYFNFSRRTRRPTNSTSRAPLSRQSSDQSTAGSVPSHCNVLRLNGYSADPVSPYEDGPSSEPQTPDRNREPVELPTRNSRTFNNLLQSVQAVKESSTPETEQPASVNPSELAHMMAVTDEEMALLDMMRRKRAVMQAALQQEQRSLVSQHMTASTPPSRRTSVNKSLPPVPEAHIEATARPTASSLLLDGQDGAMMFPTPPRSADRGPRPAPAPATTFVAELEGDSCLVRAASLSTPQSSRSSSSRRVYNAADPYQLSPELDAPTPSLDTLVLGPQTPSQQRQYAPSLSTVAGDSSPVDDGKRSSTGSSASSASSAASSLEESEDGAGSVLFAPAGEKLLVEVQVKELSAGARGSMNDAEADVLSAWRASGAFAVPLVFRA